MSSDVDDQSCSLATAPAACKVANASKDIETNQVFVQTGIIKGDLQQPGHVATDGGRAGRHRRFVNTKGSWSKTRWPYSTISPGAFASSAEIFAAFS